MTRSALTGLLATATLGLAGSAALAEDETRLYFVSHRSGTPQIYVMNVDGSNQQALTSGTRANYDPAVSPDGTKIAFTSVRDGDEEIYLMNANGSQATNVTHSPGTLDTEPTFSPDGTRIVFVRATLAPQGSDLYRMLVDGSDQVNITNTVDILEGFPDWAPDNSRIAFARGVLSDPANLVLYTIAPDGTSLSRLSQSTGPQVDPDWSPDSQEIAFTKADFPPTSSVLGGDLYVVNRDGSNEHAITSGAAKDAQPAWLTAEKLAFTSNRGPNPGFYDIFAEVAGQPPAPLTSGQTINEQPATRPKTLSPNDIDVNKEGPDVVYVGEKATLTISVTNRGTTAGRVNLLDIFGFSVDDDDATLEIQFDDSRCKSTSFFSAPAVECTIDLQAGATESVEITVRPSERLVRFFVGGFSNEAHVLVGGADKKVRKTFDLIECATGSATRSKVKPKGAICGTNRPDRLKGTPRSDVISGKRGNDRIDGRQRKDRLYGAEGNDSLKGGPDNDFLKGGSGKDSHDGGPGRDTCVGEQGERFISCEVKRIQ